MTRSSNQPKENQDLSLWIHIIESPSADDIFDAQTEGSLLRESLRLAGIPVEYNIAVNPEKFVSAFKRFFARRVEQPNSLPILHLSMHGDFTGIELTDGTFISWKILSEILYLSAEGRLLLCMSSCFGFNAFQMAMKEKEDPLPFLAVVGHESKVSLSDAAVGYSAFYHRLFKGAKVPEALDAMKAAAGDKRFLVISGDKVQKLWTAHIARQREAELNSLLSGLLGTKPR